MWSKVTGSSMTLSYKQWLGTGTILMGIASNFRVMIFTGLHPAHPRIRVVTFDEYLWSEQGAAVCPVSIKTFLVWSNIHIGLFLSSNGCVWCSHGTHCEYLFECILWKFCVLVEVSQRTLFWTFLSILGLLFIYHLVHSSLVCLATPCDGTGKWGAKSDPHRVLQYPFFLGRKLLDQLERKTAQNWLKFRAVLVWSWFVVVIQTFNGPG